MALTIYGSPQSRTMRTLWIAEELGLEYDHVPVAWSDPWLKTAAFLRINPTGTVPAIDHDGFGLGESIAINLYLAKTFGTSGSSPLYPTDPKGEAEVWRWSLWAQQHLEPWVRRDGGKPVYRGSTLDRAMAEARRGLDQLESTLIGRGWLCGDHFSMADFNVACVLSPSRSSALDMTRHAFTAAWLKRCYERPAARAVREKFRTS